MVYSNTNYTNLAVFVGWESRTVLPDPLLGVSPAEVNLSAGVVILSEAQGPLLN